MYSGVFKHLPWTKQQWLALDSCYYFYISISLPHLECLPFFTSRRYKTHSIYFSKCFMACLEKRPGIYFSHYILPNRGKCSHICQIFCVLLYEIIMFYKFKMSHITFSHFSVKYTFRNSQVSFSICPLYSISMYRSCSFYTYYIIFQIYACNHHNSLQVIVL